MACEGFEEPRADVIWTACFLTLSLANSLSPWALENTTLGGEAAGGVVEGAGEVEGVSVEREVSAGLIGWERRRGVVAKTC